MESFQFGKTALGMAIPAFKFGKEGPEILILGGVHGNEIEGTTAAFGLLDRFSFKYDYKLKLTLVPAFNLDGVIKQSRVNGNGVDLNRNLPTNDWNPKAFDVKYPPGPSPCSESENKALVLFLDKVQPRFIISLHSWHPLLNVNGDCVREAESISKATGYEIKEEIGYPTPGCLGTYAGLERKMPTLTYEIERGLALEKVLEIHVPAILAALKISEKER
jgi:murein peptide amidase A